MSEDKEERRIGLCYRCEHRARHLETGGKWQPRCECGQEKSASGCCYMYEPVMPVLTEKWPPDDERPRFGPSMISSRERVCRLPTRTRRSFDTHKVEHGEVVLALTEIDGKAMLYWKPDTEEENDGE